MILCSIFKDFSVPMNMEMINEVAACEACKQMRHKCPPDWYIAPYFPVPAHSFKTYIRSTAEPVQIRNKKIRFKMKNLNYLYIFFKIKMKKLNLKS